MAATKHTWTFRRRFRERAFGWKSQPAVQRVKEAVAEIRKVARADPLLAGEGAVLFLEKVSPALEQVDSSSGSIGNAVNKAVDALVAMIAKAPADDATRERWLERLWEAVQDDRIPYIERLGDRWGEVCVTAELASRWADRLLGITRRAWSDDPAACGHFAGTTACLSALLAAGRHDELLELLERAPSGSWHYRCYGARALAAIGKADEAVRYAEAGRALNDSPTAIARECEEILLSDGQRDAAYARFALLANRAGTRSAWFRAVAKKYPERDVDAVLDDLIAYTPGEEGKWFAAAKDAKRFDKAIALARSTPCDPLTLTRAARDFAEANPAFAIEAGCIALYWLARGHGYELTSADVLEAHRHTMAAATHAGRTDEIRARFHELVLMDWVAHSSMKRALERALT